MNVNRVEDSAISTKTNPATRDTTNNLIAFLEVQHRVESRFGPPTQMLGGRHGTLTLRYDWTGQDVVHLLRNAGAVVLSSGLTPIRIGGAAIVPSVVATLQGVTVMARGRVSRDALDGIDIVLAESSPLSSSNHAAVIDFMAATLSQLPNEDEAVAALLYRMLDARFDMGQDRGDEFLGKLLRALGTYVGSRHDSGLSER